MKKYLLMLSVAVLGFVSCTQMNDTHIKYRNEDIYSGKVSNVRGYPGIGTATIAWDNPSDYKSKKIFIEYYCFEDSINYFVPDNVFDENTSKLTCDSVQITGLKYDMAYTYKVYTLDVDNNKSIADSVVVLNKTIESLQTLIGPAVDVSYESKTQSATGVESVKITISKLSVSAEYEWTGDLAFEVMQNGKVIYSEDNVGLPTVVVNDKGKETKKTTYSFSPGAVDFSNNQVALDIAVHIGMHPVVKDGLSSNNITMSDKFTWHGNFSQRVEKPVTAAVAE